MVPTHRLWMFCCQLLSAVWDGGVCEHSVNVALPQRSLQSPGWLNHFFAGYCLFVQMFMRMSHPSWGPLALSLLFVYHSSVHCCSHDGTWKQAPQWWRWRCRRWISLSSARVVADPTGLCIASTASSELPGPAVKQMKKVLILFSLSLLN